MRLGIYPSLKSRWPWVDVEKWKSSPVTVIQPDMELQTFLKAFEGAPVWTLEELNLFEQCFTEYGLVRKGKNPTNKSLRREVNQ